MKKWVIFLVIGLSLVALGAGDRGSDFVECDGQPMVPGDTCQYTNRSGDVTSEETYDEVAENSAAAHQTWVTWGRWTVLGIGIGLAGLGIWGVVRERRRRKAQGPSTADMYLQQQAAAQAGAGHAQPAHTPPQPQYPPQQYAQPQQYQQPRSWGNPPPSRPQGGPVPPPQGDQDFGPGSGDDVTQRMR
jgi:hypothetical protein